MENLIKTILKITIAIYVVFGAVLFIFQKNYVYFPDNQDFISCSEFADSEKLNLDGTRVYYKKNSEKLAIFYHGNAGSACGRAYIKNQFQKLGLSYLIVEYAGYSGDTQKPSKKLLMKDVENVNKFIANREFTEIILVGESLGASLAVYHSSIFDVDKLLLISPFYQMVDIAKRSYGVIYPISLMLTEDYSNSEWMNISQARSVEIIHGDADEIIPIEHSKKLFEEIKIKNKKFVEIVGAHHNNMFEFEETYLSIGEFLSK